MASLALWFSVSADAGPLRLWYPAVAALSRALLPAMNGCAWISLTVTTSFHYVLNFAHYTDNLDLYFKNGNLSDFFVDTWIKSTDKKMVHYFV